MPKLQQYEFAEGSSQNMAGEERVSKEEKKMLALQINF
jgi:hypothetical protein